eukprot:CAMPEP_0203696790 /NCGR_PEP_ID=MMETSP0091-20130426/7911_1 /ASSEMBLY_ACC=CAM_ASM_001089 /TAXON_ID=426623 /ORGANISM="Chaetoceros affinis, Strain CCMP159" /LENGTH=98 /DNA_ID=CAMNT_0050568631 /DNA_START=19 /DNA_END=311 /DNA_ORIENTATION=-
MEQIIKRKKDDTQMGMMGGLLEQLRVQKDKEERERISKNKLNNDEDDGYDGDNSGYPTSGSSIPHFVYASSSEIYNVHDQNRRSNNNNKYSDDTSSNS